MTTIIGMIKDNRISGRAVYASYEDAVEVLEPGTFIEETEQTGPLLVGGFWDGEKYIAPTQDDIIEYQNIVNAKNDELTKQILEQQATE